MVRWVNEGTPTISYVLDTSYAECICDASYRCNIKVQTIQKICKRKKILNLNQNMINRRPITIITIISFGTPFLESIN